MAKRKTISIKKVKLIRPAYKPPQRIVNIFTSPLGIRPEDLQVDVKKKRKHIKSVKIEKPKQIHKPKQRFEFTKGKSLELKHKKKRVREKAKITMPKTARIGKKPKPTRAEKKVIKQKKSTFASAFPTYEKQLQIWIQPYCQKIPQTGGQCEIVLLINLKKQYILLYLLVMRILKDPSRLVQIMLSMNL